MAEHSLKIWPYYFERVVEGVKTAELRNDRGFAIADTLILREWDPFYPIDEVQVEGRYTGRECRAIITEITRGEEWLQPGIVALSIRTEASQNRTEALERLYEAAQKLLSNVYALEDEDAYEYAPSDAVDTLRGVSESLVRMEAELK